jgi:hypothetical protein
MPPPYPHELTPCMDLWVEVHRVQLIARTRDQVSAGTGSTAGAGL